MPSVYLGVRVPSKPYQKIHLEIDLQEKVGKLKENASLHVGYLPDQLDLMRYTRHLNDNLSMAEEGIQAGDIIFVRAKPITAPPRGRTISDIDVEKIAKFYRDLPRSFFIKATRREVVKKIIKKYPAFRYMPGAIGFITEPSLLSALQEADSIRRIAENYAVIIDAAEYIIKATNELTPVQKTPAPVATTPNATVPAEENFSDSSSSSEISMPPTRPQRHGALDQLLFPPAAASNNSDGAPGSSDQQNTDHHSSNAATSSAATSSPMTPTPSRITISMFNNALSQVLRSNPSAVQLPASVPDNNVSAANSEDVVMSYNPHVHMPADVQSLAPIFLLQLQQMREMGFRDNERNLRALIICNGDVDEAIELVFSGTGN